MTRNAVIKLKNDVYKYLHNKSKDILSEAMYGGPLTEGLYNYDGVEINFVSGYDEDKEPIVIWSVFSFSKGSETVYVKFYGYQDYYDGGSYEGWEFVEPHQETIYKAVK